MKTLFLVQVLLKEKTELCNYAYYEKKLEAVTAANCLRENKLLNAEYVRIIEIKYY